MTLTSPPKDIQDVLSWISCVPTGKAVIDLFNRVYRSKVSFQPYPREILSRLSRELPEGMPVGACFVHDGTNGTIHYDSSTALGILAAFIVHELSHATDANLWNAQKLKKGSKARLGVLRNSELRAFQTQQKFVREMKAANLEFQRFMEDWESRLRILAEDFSPSEIQSLYGFKS